MIFIPPMEIATRIMTLVDNAKTELILVSPYINIDNWSKFKKCLQRAVDRGVNITIYARENANQNLDTVRAFNVNLILVKDLHAKIYLNDNYAIASSQNLIQYSDDNSIDFGYATETKEEREQLLSLINQYLNISKSQKATETEDLKVVEVKANTIEEIVEFKNYEIRKLFYALRDKYDMIRIDGNETYVFCTKMFPFADVMFREGLEIRFNRQFNIKPIFETIENIDFSSNHYKYKLECKSYLDRNPRIMYKPINVVNFQNLIYDYVFMCKKIKEATHNIKEKRGY